MTSEESLRAAFMSVEVASDFSEALLEMNDKSRLHFRHRVGERWVRADPENSQAQALLAGISRFRLNGKHLEIFFADASRWEIVFGQESRTSSAPAEEPKK